MVAKEGMAMAAASICPSFSSLPPSYGPVSLSHLLYIQDRVNWGSVYAPLSVVSLHICTYIYVFFFMPRQPEMHNSIFPLSYSLGALIKVNPHYDH